MFAQFGAKRAAVGMAALGFDRVNFRVWAAVSLVTVSLAGCLPTAPPPVSADPADPGAKVAATTYRSTMAPYVAMRPTGPTGWGGQNGSGPAPKPEK
jgi:hypothetical protein